MSEQPAPLSEKRVSEIELDFLAGTLSEPVWRILGLALVAEVRRLRDGTEGDVADLRDQVGRISRLASDARQERDDAKAEVARLRGLLRNWAGHKAGCPAWMDPASSEYGPCTCGWVDIERELAGEEAGT